MADHISPYALLCACRPKKAPSYITEYDLFSRAQQAEDAVGVAPTSSISAAPLSMPPVASTPAAPPAPRTHYISDIHARHASASSRISFASKPLL